MRQIGQAQQGYSYFFAATAAIDALGPLLFMGLRRVVDPAYVMYGCIGVGAVAGVLLLLPGQSSVWAFAALLAVFGLAESLIRPYLVNELLYANEGDTGSAGSVLNFRIIIFGFAGMIVIMAPFSTYVAGIGVITIASMVLACVAWRAARAL